MPGAGRGRSKRGCRTVAAAVVVVVVEWISTVVVVARTRSHSAGWHSAGGRAAGLRPNWVLNLAEAGVAQEQRATRGNSYALYLRTQ